MSISFGKTRSVCSAVALALAISTTGCATTGLTLPGSGGSTQSGVTVVPLTAAEQQLREDGDRVNKTVIGGVIMGAAIGAGVGLLAAVLVGGNSKDRRNAAIAGAAAGAALGGIDGYVTAKKAQAGRNEVRALQAMAGDVGKDNDNLQAYIATSDTVLEEATARMSALEADIASNKASTQQVTQQHQREQKNIALMSKALDQAKKTREQYAEAAAKAGGSPDARRDLEAQIERMTQQVARLEQNIANYNKILVVSKA